MSKKLRQLKKESYENITKLVASCDKVAPKEEALNLKKYYMNKYGNYMAGKIFSILFVEIMIMIVIMNSRIDMMWNGIPYAETIIYGSLWGSGGLYLAQMLVKVVIRTYDLKKAIDSDKVMMNSCRVTFDKYDSSYRITKTCLYIKQKRRNQLMWFFERKSKIRCNDYNIESNIEYKEPTGTELNIYSVDDKRRDLFLMVKGRPIHETADKVLKEMWTTNMYMNKAKLIYIKTAIKDKIIKKK